jgi:hypothetical protein
MTEYRVEWQDRSVRGGLFDDPVWRVLFVEAATPGDAKAIATNHIERTHGINAAEFNIRGVAPAPHVPAGRVL